MNCLRAAAAGCVLFAVAMGQVSTGDVGYVFNSIDGFSIFDPTTGASTSYVTGYFPNNGTAESILWDPANPNDFIIGGSGFVGRATVTAPGAAVFTVLTTASGNAAQISWGPQGEIIVIDTTSDTIRSVDPQTGAVATLSNGPQPWGAFTESGAYDPATGAVFVATFTDVYRFDLATGTTTLAASGFNGVFGTTPGLCFDPATGDPVVAATAPPRVVRLPPGVAPVELLPPTPGTLNLSNPAPTPGGGVLLVAQNGTTLFNVVDYVVEIPPGGPPAIIGTIASQAPVCGVSVAGVAAAQPFLQVAATGGGAATLAILGLPSQTTSGWTFATAATPTPPGQGPILGITPDALSYAILALFPFPAAGNPFHWAGGFTGIFPDVPYVFPPGTVTPLTGLAMDFVGLVFDAGGAPLATPVARITWP